MIVAVVLVAVVALGAVVVSRLQHRVLVERALGRDFHRGMPLAEVTAELRRLGVEFTIDTTAGGTAIVRLPRGTTQDRRAATVTEDQIVFDAQDRLREMRTVDQITSR